MRYKQARSVAAAGRRAAERATAPAAPQALKLSPDASGCWSAIAEMEVPPGMSQPAERGSAQLKKTRPVDQGTPEHIVAKSRGYGPSVLLKVYAKRTQEG